MLAVDVEIRLDLPYGAIDYSIIETALHRGLAEAGIPVSDVIVDQIRMIDSPLGPGEGVPAPDAPIGPAGAPQTRAPGARY